MEIKIKGEKYPVVIEKKKNKNTYIRVTDELEIHVTTSFLARDKMIEKMLRENEKAIISMLDKKRKELERKEKFYYFGKNYDIIIIPTVEKVMVDETTFVIPNEHALDVYLKKQMKEVFTEHYNRLYELFEESISKPTLKFRKMKTRWGVCNRRNHTITLNTRLLEYDTKYLDYVIIHELSHLVHFDHSKAFWEVVSKYCPDYKTLRREMKG
ncbi:MAG: DUF45 domain-containing protein [Firmicutes bacterium]|nr:DUF45 domain-containing protein [Bacillota bacterium]